MRSWRFIYERVLSHHLYISALCWSSPKNRQVTDDEGPPPRAADVTRPPMQPRGPGAATRPPIQPGRAAGNEGAHERAGDGATRRPVEPRGDPEEEHPHSGDKRFFEGDELLTEEQRKALEAAVIKEVSNRIKAEKLTTLRHIFVLKRDER